jgi:hypothetical protein
MYVAIAPHSREEHNEYINLRQKFWTFKEIKRNKK